MINRRISDISCNEHEFNKAKTAYEEALAKSGFQKSMIFDTLPQPKKNRMHNFIWFNPPFIQKEKLNKRYI